VVELGCYSGAIVAEDLLFGRSWDEREGGSQGLMEPVFVLLVIYDLRRSCSESPQFIHTLASCRDSTPHDLSHYKVTAS